MARILAKALNCENAKGPTPTPCLKCESCKAIARGDDIDVIEIDAASNTGVDNVRDLISNAQFMPARSRFKIYIIDEVHMLSKSAFNALLKIMEEPPPHVKFILATTEPEKVLPTILSRCQRYDFRNIPTREIADHLKSVCKQEKIKADDDALLLIAKAGAGSMRDSLSLLDRLLSIGEKELTIDLIENMLGLPRAQLIFDLAQSIGEGNVKAVLTAADKMIAGGLSPDTLIASLVDHLRNLLILRTCGSDCDLVEIPGLAPKDLDQQSNRFDPVTLSQDIAILEELRRQMRTSQAGRALLDATLVRLALADQFTSIGELLGASSNGATTAKSAPPALKKNAEPSLLSPEARGGVRGETIANSTPNSTEQTTSEDDDDLPAPGKVWDNSGPSLSELLKQQATNNSAPAPETANVEPVNSTDLPEVWARLLRKIEERGPALYSLVSKGRLVCIEDGRAVIEYDRQHETFVKLLDRNGKKDVLREALTDIYGQPLGLRFSLTAAEPETATTIAIESAPPPPRPAITPVHRAVEPPQPTAPQVPVVKITPDLVESLRCAEPLIKALMDDLGATIVKVEDAATA
jgi:DNA polymerase-3 subunit gamma/tau